MNIKNVTDSSIRNFFPK